MRGESGSPNDGDLQTEELISISIDVYTLDEFFGDYQEKLRLQSQSRTSGLESAFLPREPVSVIGNVEGGFGLIGSFNAARIDID